MTDIEINPEGVIIKPIDAFPRQTPDEGTPPVPPVTEPKTPENGEGITPSTPTVVPPVVPPTTEVPPVPPVTPPAQPVTPTAPKADEPDYKKKFSESTRRNQIVESQNRELQRILGEITKQEPPTDDEMKALIPDWEYLSDREKNTERNVFVLTRDKEQRALEIARFEAEKDTLSKLDTFITNEPRLEGKEDEFYEFVSRPNNQGATAEVLLNAFLFETTPITAPAIPVDAVPPSLERGTPSGNMPPVTTGKTEMSDEEISLLRTTDHKKYMEMVRKGQI